MSNVLFYCKYNVGTTVFSLLYLSLATHVYWFSSASVSSHGLVLCIVLCLVREVYQVMV